MVESARRRVVICALLLFACALGLACVPRAALAADETAQAQADSAVDEQAGFGLNGFTRYMRGAQRAVDGVDIGYRFPVPEGATVTVINTPQSIWVHVEAQAAAAAGLDADDAKDTDALIALIKQLDETHSRGGTVLADEDKPWHVTTDADVIEGACRYVFALEMGESRYTAVQPAEIPAGSTPAEAAEAAGLDLGDAVLWVDDAELVAADEVAREAAPTWMDQLYEFFCGMDYRPFWVSLKTSAVALAVTFALGLVAAWKTMGTSSRLKGLLDSVFTIPMVLPPTVCGFLLLLVFGQSTPVGRWLIDHGIALVFTWPAAVISAIVVSFPLMYRTALGAFEGLDAQMLDAARTLGWSEGRIFRQLMLPLAWPSIAAGTVLAFARAMGEFGCTLFFAGNYAGETQTIPIAIYFQWMSGNTDVALFWVIVVILFSFLVILFINIYTARSQRYRTRGMAGTSARVRTREAASAHGDGLEEHGGDALRIDREALAELLLGDEDAGRG